MQNNNYTNLVIINNSQISERKRLFEAITRKKLQIDKLSRKIENLKWQLSRIKKEYSERIGGLYVRLNELDHQIVIWQKIIRLIKGGLSYQEARKKAFKKNNYLHIENEVFVADENPKKNTDELKQIKQLYRKLIQKYHPDLTQNADEKRRREKIMKKINRAYEDESLAVLQDIDEEANILDYECSTIEFLQSKLIELISTFHIMQNDYKILCQSEWNQWKKKINRGKREKRDIFAALALKINMDIRYKKILINDIKRTYE